MEEPSPKALSALLNRISDRLGSAIDTLRNADGQRERALRQLGHASTQLRQARDVAGRIGPEAREASCGNLTLLVHDMRAPLTAILGWAQLLRAHGGDEAITLRAIETIERNGKMLVAMLDDISRTRPPLSGREPRVQRVTQPVAHHVDGGDPRDPPRPPQETPPIAERVAPLGPGPESSARLR
jgi:hypothetical protein